MREARDAASRSEITNEGSSRVSKNRLKNRKGHMERAFPNRTEAGRLLAKKLVKYAGRDDVIVLGLPRGGVPVAFEVAQRLGAPLDVFIVRKLGVPGFEELAVGAIASGGVRVLNEDVMRALPNADQLIESVTERETVELDRREQTYRNGRAAPSCATASSFWLTTDWRRVQPCALRSKHCASAA